MRLSNVVAAAREITMARPYRRHSMVDVIEARWMITNVLPSVCLTDKITAVTCALLCNAHSRGNLEYRVEPRDHNWVVEEWRINRKIKTGRLHAYVNIMVTLLTFDGLAKQMERHTRYDKKKRVV
jgi:hypothetical protein